MWGVSGPSRCGVLLPCRRWGRWCLPLRASRSRATGRGPGTLAPCQPWVDERVKHVLVVCGFVVFLGVAGVVSGALTEERPDGDAPKITERMPQSWLLGPHSPSGSSPGPSSQSSKEGLGSRNAEHPAASQ